MVNRRKQDIRYLLLFAGAIIVLNLLSSYFFTRIDFTKEKRFTLSPITKSILHGLKKDVQVTVYLEGDFPGGFKRLRNSTRDMLADLKAYSNGKLHYDFVNPSIGNEEEQLRTSEELAGKGIEPTYLSVRTESGQSQKLIFPGALVTYNGRQLPVKLFHTRIGATPDQAEEILNNSVQDLEYEFASAIKKATEEGKPRIGFTEGHGELTDLQLADAMASLGDGYEAGRIDLGKVTFAGLDKLKLLIVPKPDTRFTEAEKYKIDYFVMKGGRVLWAIDNVNAELDSLQGHGGQQMTFVKDLNLDDMLFKYGVRVNYNLIADMNCAQIPISVGNVAGQAQIQMLPWVFYPVFMPVSAHPLVKNLNGIRSEFASTIDTIAVKGINKQVILSSSPYSQTMRSPGMISLQMVERNLDPNAFKGSPLPVGVLLEGSFPSDFNNRPVPEGVGVAAELPQKSRFTKMIVISDGDILKNQVSSKDNSPFPLGFDRYTNQQFGNKTLLLNIADYLTDDSGIIELRNKEVKLRLLDKGRARNEKLFWQSLNIGLPLLLILLFGAARHFWRKRKYAAAM